MEVVMHVLKLTQVGVQRSWSIDAAINGLVIAAWTGRDSDAVQSHIMELEKIGVPRPKTTPIFYRGSTNLLTTHSSVEVVGEHSSGEVEPVIFSLPDGLWLGIGSDHADRKLETVGITISKQLCIKPVGAAVWPFDEVADHWDEIIIRAYAFRNGAARLYQEAVLGRMHHPWELMNRYCGNGKALSVGTAMFCGTVAVRGEIGPADKYDLEIEDPILGRRLRHSYSVSKLPIEG
jgi:hypothetical protein